MKNDVYQGLTPGIMTGMGREWKMPDVEIWLDRYSGPRDICNRETIRCYESGGYMVVHVTAGLEDRVADWIRAFRNNSHLSCATAQIPGQITADRGPGFEIEEIPWNGTGQQKAATERKGMKSIFLTGDSAADDGTSWYRTLVDAYERGYEITAYIDGKLQTGTAKWLEWSESLNSMSVLAPYCGRSHVYKANGFRLHRVSGSGGMEPETDRLSRTERKRVFNSATRLAIDMAIRGKYSGIQSRLYRLEDVSWEDTEKLKEHLEEILELAAGMASNLEREADIEKVRELQAESKKI